MTKSTPIPPSSSSRSETWPTERFYWSIVECPGRVVPMSGTLLLLMEDDLPIESELLHAVGVRLDDRRVLACAAAKDELAALDPSVVTLTPTAIPDGVPGGGSIDPGLLNLLINDFEPFPLRRERRVRSRILFGTLLLLTVVASLGLWRRASTWTNVANGMDSRAQQLLKNTVAPLAPANPGTNHEALLDQELLRLRQTRWTAGTKADSTASLDATDALGMYLALWPKTEKVRADFLSVTPTSIALSLRTMRGEDASVADSQASSEPTALVAKLPRPAGWMMDEPRLTIRDGYASLALQLRRESAAGSGGTP